MIKKEKILHSYITNIIQDEKPKKIFIYTSQDVSKLVRRIEKLNVNTLSIGPEIQGISEENFDLFIERMNGKNGGVEALPSSTSGTSCYTISSTYERGKKKTKRRK